MKWGYVSVILVLFFSVVFGEDKNLSPKSTKDLADEGNLEITSKSLNYDHVNRVAIFTGDVKVINGNITMTSDKMTCYFNDTNDIYLVIAEGKVVITRDKVKATSEKAVYKIPEKMIILSKNPQLNDGVNNVKARLITFFEDKKNTEFDDPVVELVPKEKSTEPKK